MEKHDDYKGEDRRKPIHPVRWTALTIWIVAFTIITVLALQKANTAASQAKILAAASAALSMQNAALQKDIQESRVSSCIRTYTVIQAILTESVSGAQLDAVGRDKLNRMRKLADPQKCVAQTSVRRANG